MRRNSQESVDHPENFSYIVPSQRHWSLHDLPDILYQFQPTQRFTRKHPEVPEKPSPYPGGPNLRCLDILPDRISTNVAEWRVEAWMRIDRRVRLQDIVDRMLPVLGVTCNSLQQRGVRFRQLFHMITWGTGNQRTKEQRVKLIALLQRKRISLEKNTTRGLSPGLIDPSNPRSERIPLPKDYKPSQERLVEAPVQLDASDNDQSLEAEGCSASSEDQGDHGIQGNGSVDLPPGANQDTSHSASSHDTHADDENEESDIGETGEGNGDENNDDNWDDKSNNDEDTASENNKSDDEYQSDDSNASGEIPNKGKQKESSTGERPARNSRKRQNYDSCNTALENDEEAGPSIGRRQNKRRKTLTLLEEEQQARHRLVNCPICNVGLKLRDIESHMESCTSPPTPENQDNAPEPQQSSFPRKRPAGKTTAGKTTARKKTARKTVDTATRQGQRKKQKQRRVQKTAVRKATARKSVPQSVQASEERAETSNIEVGGEGQVEVESKGEEQVENESEYNSWSDKNKEETSEERNTDAEGEELEKKDHSQTYAPNESEHEDINDDNPDSKPDLVGLSPEELEEYLAAIEQRPVFTYPEPETPWDVQANTYGYDVMLPQFFEEGANYEDNYLDQINVSTAVNSEGGDPINPSDWFNFDSNSASTGAEKDSLLRSVCGHNEYEYFKTMFED
ncbi:hypothetical protein LOZ61_005209 [Ophidiomyces ophidiicola]|uniref:uncharacterized protein n=1 Tax=Ophidiomyces ophidiicola TaxID=1387563 RepID=UPI0020C4F0E4|nr:uncharacterized protein LOZ57_004983 [Ophidiomyces ophidiicola]KAI1909068.1 hypothetical protein LOZ61_005209 [Ophidiomyces ophidiicola]KAI1922949.1 hypothetical protein LOZ60_005433 [Ophidiomyces ophidiicola]KAI1944305.1 hypothetical protein LOZ57_004983 [Ophidiomyces ophidiicola]KAI1957280.1 hypothetical protein LOZ59_003946 [Ophidiomyces ophidiicola]KAI2009138.1 hypothetical protein LOZ49_004002 [Ophidiomyces ophidiicola]